MAVFIVSPRRLREANELIVPTRINFPGGAGGNWLVSVLILEPESSASRVHWHDRSVIDNPFYLEHRLDDEFDLLFSGTYCFNFYLNVLFKKYLTDRLFGCTYQQRFDKMYEVARWLYDWNSIQGPKKSDFLFDDLIKNHLTFYQSVCRIQQSHNLPCININEFDRRRDLFLASCVKSDDQFGNLDDMTFVIFVLAWLERQGFYPHESTHFVMNHPDNQHLCKKFAFEHYHLCPPIQSHVFASGRPCPDFLSDF